MNTPNKLTIFRIILVIPLIILFSIFAWYVKTIQNPSGFENVTTNKMSQYFLYASGIIFIISMITDFFDGYLARKNDQISMFGKLFDPLADKIITTTTLIFLTIFNYTYIYLTLIFIIRDLIVDGSRNVAATKKLKVEASIFGKLKTLFQSLAIPILLFLSPLIDKSIWWHSFILNIPMIIACLMSIISGFFYFKQIIPFIKKEN